MSIYAVGFKSASDGPFDLFDCPNATSVLLIPPSHPYVWRQFQAAQPRPFVLPFRLPRETRP